MSHPSDSGEEGIMTGIICKKCNHPLPICGRNEILAAMEVGNLSHEELLAKLHDSHPDKAEKLHVLYW